MRVAIVHDYIKEYGGAERVLEAIHDVFPDSTVFSAVYLPQFLGPHEKRFRQWKIVTSSCQQIPFVEKLISPLRVFSPWIFEGFDLFLFDLIIVSQTGAYIPNLIVRKPDSVHICYSHTPPRYLYGYATARDWRKHWWGRVAGTLINHHLRQVDFVSAQRPDQFIANSNETKRRIAKFYRQDATVIYPPVEMVDAIKNSKFKIQNSKSTEEKKYYVAGGRLARAKHIDLAIQACNILKLPLKVFGRGFAQYDSELKEIAGPTIEFVGEVTDEQLMKLYKESIALLYPSEDEDFGIIPVEAQACGTPVVAYRSGGVLETVIDGVTGVFFPSLTKESLIDGMKLLKSKKITRELCAKNAQRFSKTRFQKEMKKYIQEVMKREKQ